MQITALSFILRAACAVCLVPVFAVFFYAAGDESGEYIRLVMRIVYLYEFSLDADLFIDLCYILIK